MVDEDNDKVDKVDNVDHARKILESLTNRFGCEKDLEDLAMNMASMHRTLVQSFTGGFIIPFVRELARMKRVESFDARNESACKACLIMCEALEKEYGICSGEKFTFPMV